MSVFSLVIFEGSFSKLVFENLRYMVVFTAPQVNKDSLYKFGLISAPSPTVVDVPSGSVQFQLGSRDPNTYMKVEFPGNMTSHQEVATGSCYVMLPLPPPTFFF